MSRALLLIVLIAPALAPLAAADALPDRVDAEGLSVGFRASAPIAGTPTWSASGLPPGIRISSAGDVSGTLTFDAAGAHDVVLRATSLAGEWTGTFVWTVRDVNRPPSVTNVGLQIARVGEPFALQLRAADPDGDALRYEATGLPAGLALDPATGLVAGAPTTPGVRVVSVTATDSGHAVALSARFSFPILVEGPTNAPPDCSAAAPSTATLWPPNGKSVPVGVAGVTDADGDAIVLRVASIASSEPAATSGVGTSTAWLPAARAGAGDGRVYTVAFTATDAKGASCSGSVRVDAPHDLGLGADGTGDR